MSFDFSTMKNSSRLQNIISLILALVGSAALFSANQTVEIHVNDAATPPSERHGWDPSQLTKAEVQTARVFALDDPTFSSEGAQVELWDYAQQINGGEHFPTFRQETGDCVSMGAANAVNYLQAVQIGLHGAPFELRSVYQPWIYGVSRTAKDLGAGRLGRSAGSVGSWAAKAVQQYGVLAADESDVPNYSKRIAEEWGFRGPPQKYFDSAKDFCVRTVALVDDYEDARDALSNGYPVTVASNQGFRMEGRAFSGKLFGQPQGHWAHQMCFIGVDDEAKCPNGSQGALYCLNSWGTAAHGEPVDDAPPGGFWVDRRTAERMLKQGDSWAFSSFDGFPLRDLDFRVFRGAPVDVAEIPETDNMQAAICYALLGIEARQAILAGVGVILLSLASCTYVRRKVKQISTGQYSMSV